MKIGKLPVNAMKRSVLGQIRTKRNEVVSGAGLGRDCAILSFGGKKTAACMQEAALELEEGPAAGEALNAGDQAGGEVWGRELHLSMADLIQKCANNLAAGGVRIAAVTIALLLPEEMQEPRIRALMAEAEGKCRELSAEIAGGQTRITTMVSSPWAVVTGYGAAPEENHTVRAAAPGQDVVLSKWIGLQGTALAAKRHRQKLLERYPAWLVEQAAGLGRYLSVLPEAEAAMRHGVCAMHDASEGGIFGALWELAEGAGAGLRIDMRKLPLRQETVEVCERCGLNPYELLSGGCLVMTSWDGTGLAAALEEAHIPAAIVGKVTEGNDKILINGEEIRYLDRPNALFLA